MVDWNFLHKLMFDVIWLIHFKVYWQRLGVLRTGFELLVCINRLNGQKHIVLSPNSIIALLQTQRQWNCSHAPVSFAYFIDLVATLEGASFLSLSYSCFPLFIFVSHFLSFILFSFFHFLPINLFFFCSPQQPYPLL